MKIIPNFIDDTERGSILEFTDTLSLPQGYLSNHHIREVRQKTGGVSVIWDISKTDVSTYISSFQSSGTQKDAKELPQIFLDLQDRISGVLDIDKRHSFLQIVKMDSGGKIPPHYDTCYPGYITLKCNISAVSENYIIWLEKLDYQISQGDLYCFEASLFKHWTEPFTSPRVLLSYGFCVEYEKMNRHRDDLRVRLSERIYKYFQSKKEIL
jgi:hypothetical protein